jgi:DNA-binding LacI/PurR family transcriptional regulator
MANLPVSTVTAQVAAHLKERILQGEWRDFLPGRDRLAAETGVSHMTVGRALAQLEQEGLLAAQGHGRRRRILLPETGRQSRKLRIAVLRFEPEDTKLYFVVEFVHQLREAGHQVLFADQTQSGLKLDVKRVAKLVEKTAADAWIVIAGSDEILEWFANRPTPCFGLFGSISTLPIAGAGPSKNQAYAAAARRLVELGHRRIVLLARWAAEQGTMVHFLEELKAMGIPVGDYNRPVFSDSPEDLQRLLNSLFATTPPTAIVAGDLDMYHAAQQFLARRKLLVPEDVSLISGDPDPSFGWYRPTVAHFNWDSALWVRRIVRWAENIAHGKSDTRKALTQAEFVDGGTVGPATVEGFVRV